MSNPDKISLVLTDGSGGIEVPVKLLTYSSTLNDMIQDLGISNLKEIPIVTNESNQITYDGLYNLFNYIDIYDKHQAIDGNSHTDDEHKNDEHYNIKKEHTLEPWEHEFFNNLMMTNIDLPLDQDRSAIIDFLNISNILSVEPALKSGVSAVANVIKNKSFENISSFFRKKETKI